MLYRLDLMKGSYVEAVLCRVKFSNWFFYIVCVLSIQISKSVVNDIASYDVMHIYVAAG